MAGAVDVHVGGGASLGQVSVTEVSKTSSRVTMEVENPSESAIVGKVGLTSVMRLGLVGVVTPTEQGFVCLSEEGVSMDFSIYDNGEVDASGWYLGDADDVLDHAWDRQPAIRGGKVGVAFSWQDLSLSAGSKITISFIIAYGQARLDELEREMFKPAGNLSRGRNAAAFNGVGGYPCFEINGEGSDSGLDSEVTALVIITTRLGITSPLTAFMRWRAALRDSGSGTCNSGAMYNYRTWSSSVTTGVCGDSGSTYFSIRNDNNQCDAYIDLHFEKTGGDLTGIGTGYGQMSFGPGLGRVWGPRAVLEVRSSHSETVQIRMYRYSATPVASPTKSPTAVFSVSRTLTGSNGAPATMVVERTAFLPAPASEVAVASEPALPSVPVGKSELRPTGPDDATEPYVHPRFAQSDSLNFSGWAASSMFSQSTSWWTPEPSPPGGSATFSYLESMSRTLSLTCTRSAISLIGCSNSLTEVCAEVPTYIRIPLWVFSWKALPITGTQDTGPNGGDLTGIIIGASVGGGVLIAACVVCIIHIRRRFAATDGDSDTVNAETATRVVAPPLPEPGAVSYDATTCNDTALFASAEPEAAGFEDIDVAYVGL